MLAEAMNDYVEIDEWNYRVLCTTTPLADTGDYMSWYSIIEVYYDTDGNIVTWAEATPGGDDTESFMRELAEWQKLIETSIEKDWILDGRDLPNP